MTDSWEAASTAAVGCLNELPQTDRLAAEAMTEQPEVGEKSSSAKPEAVV